MAANISLCRWKRIIIGANQGCVLDITSIFSVKSYGAENCFYEGWNFNSGNYLFTTDTK